MEYEKITRNEDEKTAQLNVHELQLLTQIMKMVREEVAAYQHKADLERERRVVLKTSGSIEYVAIREILRCEAEGRYTKVIFGDNNSLFVSMHLKEVEMALQSNQFIRCHNSHLINRNKIRRFNKSDGGFFEMVNGDQVPVARARKEHIMSQLDSGPVKQSV
jgi:two-component system LytT family response regulator